MALILVAGLPASEVERTMMGKSLDMPLSAAANPDTVLTLNTLRRQAASTGSTRVIIGCECRLRLRVHYRLPAPVNG